MKWICAGKNTYVTMIGICNVIMYILSENEAVLIDSGSKDSDELREYLKENGIRITAVLYTHLHIDHIKNRKWLTKEHKAKLYASKEDIECSDNTEKVEALPLDLDRPFSIKGSDFALIRTFGHTPGSISVVTPDNVCCTGDAIVSLDVLNASKLPYMCDAAEAVRSMLKLKETRCSCYVPSHDQIIPEKGFADTVDANIKKEAEIFDDMTAFVREPADLDAVSDAYLRHLNISISKREGRWNEVFMSEVRARFIDLSKAGHLRLEGNIISPL